MTNKQLNVPWPDTGISDILNSLTETQQHQLEHNFIIALKDKAKSEQVPMTKHALNNEIRKIVKNIYKPDNLFRMQYFANMGQINVTNLGSCNYLWLKTFYDYLVELYSVTVTTSTSNSQT